MLTLSSVDGDSLEDARISLSLSIPDGASVFPRRAELHVPLGPRRYTMGPGSPIMRHLNRSSPLSRPRSGTAVMPRRTNWR